MSEYCDLTSLFVDLVVVLILRPGVKIENRRVDPIVNQ